MVIFLRKRIADRKQSGRTKRSTASGELMAPNHTFSSKDRQTADRQTDSRQTDRQTDRQTAQTDRLTDNAKFGVNAYFVLNFEFLCHLLLFWQRVCWLVDGGGWGWGCVLVRDGKERMSRNVSVLLLCRLRPRTKAHWKERRVDSHW